MNSALEALSTFFNSLGINPVLGAIVVGFILAKIVRVSFNKNSDSDISGSIGGTRSPVIKFSAGVKTGPSVMNFNGQDLNLSDDQAAEIMDLVSQGKKIDAIKLLRRLNDMGLTEAKQAIDRIESRPFDNK